MKKNKNPFRKPEEAWKVTKEGVLLKYPIFHYDPAIPDDPIIKKTIEAVVGDIDFYGWKGNKEDRIIDSTGKVFITKYEEVKGGRTLLFIPIIYRSGVFPGKVDRIMKITEIKQIMNSGIDNNKNRILENLEELKMKIEEQESIQEILKLCGHYF